MVPVKYKITPELYKRGTIPIFVAMVQYYHIDSLSSGAFPRKDSFDRVWFIRIVSGKARAHCRYNPVLLEEGDCWILSEEVAFSFQEANDGFVADIVSMSIRFLDNIYYSIGSLMPPAMSVACSKGMPGYCKELVERAFSDMLCILDAPLELGREQMLRAAATQLLLSFSNGFNAQGGLVPTATGGGKGQVYLNRFVSLILGSALPHRRDMEYYAGELGISTRYLYRICTQLTGQSPKQLIDGILMGGIKQALLSGVRPIGDIALDYGFEDPTAFGQYFKRHTGSTPSAFRKAGR